MPIYHESVLLKEVLNGLAVESGKKFIDATAGDGGHSLAIAEKGGKVLAIDQDDESLVRFRSRLGSFDSTMGDRITLVRGNFIDIVSIAKKIGMESVDGIIFDLGLSTYQIKGSQRGFSFWGDETLDMRMNQETKVAAFEIVAHTSEDDLAQIITKYGEEPYAKEIARAICIVRRKKPVTTTAQLAEIISEVYLAQNRFKDKKLSLHPATRVFQALRIAVNDELTNLKSALPMSLEILKRGGRLAVISFHSLEDRIVKQFMKNSLNLSIMTKDPIRPGLAEMRLNPSARSAKLRICSYDNS